MRFAHASQWQVVRNKGILVVVSIVDAHRPWVAQQNRCCCWSDTAASIQTQFMRGCAVDMQKGRERKHVTFTSTLPSSRIPDSSGAGAASESNQLPKHPMNRMVAFTIRIMVLFCGFRLSPVRHEFQMVRYHSGSHQNSMDRLGSCTLLCSTVYVDY